MLAGTGARGRTTAYAVAGALGGFVAMTAIPPTRWSLRRFVLPTPGKGPSPDSQKKGFYDLRFLGILDDGQAIRMKLTGDADPGYGSTSKMLGQVAACMAHGSREAKRGGFWTPATLFGDALIGVLQEHAGLSFTLLGSIPTTL
jgi:short subunit dehydrogenase-like uncharacterized protein